MILINNTDIFYDATAGASMVHALKGHRLSGSARYLNIFHTIGDQNNEIHYFTPVKTTTYSSTQPFPTGFNTSVHWLSSRYLTLVTVL